MYSNEQGATLKRCTACKTPKPVSEFYTSDHRCKPCSNERRRARHVRSYVPKPRKAPMTPEERRAREVARNLARRKTVPSIPRSEATYRTPKPPRIKIIREPERLTRNGLTMTRTQWAAHLGLSGRNCISMRQLRQGWPQDRALSQDVVFKNQKAAMRSHAVAHSRHDVLTHDGRTQSIEAWAAQLHESLGHTVPAILGRLKLGWTVHRTLCTKVRPYRPHDAKAPKVAPEFVGPKRPRGRPRKS